MTHPRFPTRILASTRSSAPFLVALVLVGGCGTTAVQPDGGAATDAGVDASQPLDGGSDGGAPSEPRLIALDRDGRLASIDVAAPWTVRGSIELGAGVASARCHGRRCIVAHPTPFDALSVVDAIDLTVMRIPLERGADPRDVTFMDEHTVLVSQHGRAALLELDLVAHHATPIDLSPLADPDGLPEAGRIAHCGRRAFVQLLRVEHDTGAPSAMDAVLAVIDLDRPERLVDVDAEVPGVQGIALSRRPAFDMPVDCGARRAYVVEPAPLMEGGGRYELVDLETLEASDLGLDVGAQLGGLEVVEPGLYWLITHTEFGPGASSHLTLEGGTVPDTHNTFATDHVDDLALDRATNRLFFPDPCTPTPSHTTCDPGVHVFDARTGARVSTQAIDVGFGPFELALAR